MPDPTTVTPLAQALGRVPSGLYILTARHPETGRATGMLASWVQQAGFDPPMLTVAVATQRYVGDWLRGSGRFTLNQVPAGGKPLIRHFGKGFAPEADAFAGLDLRPGDGHGGPVLASALAYLDAEVAGELTGGDHHVFLARVIGGALLDPEGEPLVHVRGNGLHY